MPIEDFNAETISGISFYSKARKQKMRYLYPDSGHSLAGWILYEHPSGQWFSLRKATDRDIEELSSAVIRGHHGH
jgi:hypothetical protein